MTRYMAIEGRGGSGKTYLSNLLEKELDAVVFHLDEYGNDYEPFIGIPKLIEAVESSNAGMVIFEGVGVFDERFDRFNAYKIFVDTPADIRKERALGRDVPTSERSEEEWKKIYDIWLEAEAKYFTSELRSKADIVVGEEDGEFDVQSIKSQFE